MQSKDCLKVCSIPFWELVWVMIQRFSILLGGSRKNLKNIWLTPYFEPEYFDDFYKIRLFYFSKKSLSSPGSLLFTKIPSDQKCYTISDFNFIRTARIIDNLFRTTVAKSNYIFHQYKNFENQDRLGVQNLIKLLHPQWDPKSCFQLLFFSYW